MMQAHEEQHRHRHKRLAGRRRTHLHLTCKQSCCRTRSLCAGATAIAAGSSSSTWGQGVHTRVLCPPCETALRAGTVRSLLAPCARAWGGRPSCRPSCRLCVHAHARGTAQAPPHPEPSPRARCAARLAQCAPQQQPHLHDEREDDLPLQQAQEGEEDVGGGQENQRDGGARVHGGWAACCCSWMHNGTQKKRGIETS